MCWLAQPRLDKILLCTGTTSSTNQPRKIPFSCTPWVPICISFNSQQRSPLSSLSGWYSQGGRKLEGWRGPASCSGELEKRRNMRDSLILYCDGTVHPPALAGAAQQWILATLAGVHRKCFSTNRRHLNHAWHITLVASCRLSGRPFPTTGCCLSPPPPLGAAKAGRNHLNNKIFPSSPLGWPAK